RQAAEVEPVQSRHPPSVRRRRCLGYLCGREKLGWLRLQLGKLLPEPGRDLLSRWRIRTRIQQYHLQHDEREDLVRRVAGGSRTALQEDRQLELWRWDLIHQRKSLSRGEQCRGRCVLDIPQVQRVPEAPGERREEPACRALDYGRALRGRFPVRRLDHARHRSALQRWRNLPAYELHTRWVHPTATLLHFPGRVGVSGGGCAVAKGLPQHLGDHSGRDG